MIKIIPMAASIPLITAEGMKCVKPPSLNTPKRICNNPAIATERKNISIDPICVMAAAQIAVKPAAGPLTLSCELLIIDITSPPIIPANRPEYRGAPEASEIPRQSGKATKKTVMLALKSNLRNERK